LIRLGPYQFSFIIYWYTVQDATSFALIRTHFTNFEQNISQFRRAILGTSCTSRQFYYVSRSEGRVDNILTQNSRIFRLFGHLYIDYNKIFSTVIKTSTLRCKICSKYFFFTLICSSKTCLALGVYSSFQNFRITIRIIKILFKQHSLIIPVKHRRLFTNTVESVESFKAVTRCSKRSSRGT
jgi:hypothetical protein